MMATGDTVKTPSVFFKQFSELFTGHEKLYAVYMLYVNGKQDKCLTWVIDLVTENTSLLHSTPHNLVFQYPGG